MAIRGVDHIDLAVTDVDRSLAFYLGMLGPICLAIEGRWSRAHRWSTRTRQRRLELEQLNLQIKGQRAQTTLDAQLRWPKLAVLGDTLRSFGATVETGRFRTDMRVELVNDGPVTVLLEV